MKKLFYLNPENMTMGEIKPSSCLPIDRNTRRLIEINLKNLFNCRILATNFKDKYFNVVADTIAMDKNKQVILVGFKDGTRDKDFLEKYYNQYLQLKENEIYFTNYCESHKVKGITIENAPIIIVSSFFSERDKFNAIEFAKEHDNPILFYEWFYVKELVSFEKVFDTRQLNKTKNSVN